MPGDAPRALVDRAVGARRDLVGSVALGVVTGALTIAGAWVLSDAIARVFLGGAGLPELTGALAALAAIAVARAAATWESDVLAQRAAARTKAAVREAAVATQLARGPLGLARERAGELTNTLTAGADALDAYLAQYVPATRLAIAVPLIVGLAVAWADLLSAVVLLVTFPLIPLFMYLIGAAARDRTRAQWVTLSRMSATFLDALQGLPTLKAFGRAEAEAQTIAERSERFRALTMEVLKLAFVSSLTLELLATLSTAIVAVEVGLRLLYARIEFREALFVLILAPEFYRPLRALGAAYHAGMAGKEASGRLLELLDESAGTSSPARPQPLVARAGGGARSVQPAPGIVFSRVRFTYVGRTLPALDEVAFALPAGKTTALVGPSGSGKSTCAALLLRFAEPDAGGIEVNGERLSHLDADAWRDRVAWVPQRPYLFSGSVADNLRVARPDASEEALRAALAAAEALGFVDALQDGLNTRIGERGARLSGGQAQRLALARAFLKDAPLLVLDEPTSQIDPWTEPAISAAVRRLRAGRTTLLIAHRFSMVRAADQVVVLAGGRVEHVGTHEDLLRQSARYRAMAGRAESIA